MDPSSPAATGRVPLPGGGYPTGLGSSRGTGTAGQGSPYLTSPTGAALQAVARRPGSASGVPSTDPQAYSAAAGAAASGSGAAGSPVGAGGGGHKMWLQGVPGYEAPYGGAPPLKYYMSRQRASVAAYVGSGNMPVGPVPHSAVAGFDGQGYVSDEIGLRPVSPTTTSGLAPDRAAMLFKAYDHLGRGYLDRAQMVAALSELGVAHGLGERGLNEVLSHDPHTSREARYSLHDFLSMYDRIGFYQSKLARDTRIKALSNASAPPADADSSLALQAVFNAYCRYASGTSRGLASGGGKEGEHEPRMNAAQLMKLVHDLDLLSGEHPALSFASVDMAFAKAKAPGGVRKLSYRQWLNALALLSDESGRDLFSLITAHVELEHPHLLTEVQAVHQGAPPGSTTDSQFEKVSAASGNGNPQADADGSAQEGPVDGGSQQKLTGRLTLLERAIMDEEARLAAQQQDNGVRRSTGRTPMAARSTPANPMSQTVPGRSRPRTSGSGLVPTPNGTAVRSHAWDSPDHMGSSPSRMRPPGGHTMAEVRARAGTTASPRGVPPNVMDAAMARAMEEFKPLTAGDSSGGVRRSDSGPHGMAGGDSAARLAEGDGGGPLSTRASVDAVAGTGGGAGGTARSARSRAQSARTSPMRPRTASPPGHYPPKVRTVQTANIATEIWRFPSAVEQDMAPVLMAIMKRLEVLETRESDRSIADAAMRADILLKSQAWERTERELYTKAHTLEARQLAEERRAADTSSLIGGIKSQVDELVANGGLSEAYKQQLQRAEQAADEAKAGLAALEGKLVASAAVAEAQAKEGREAIAAAQAQVQQALSQAKQDLTASAAAAVQAAADAAAQAEARLTQSLEDLRSMINTSGTDTEARAAVADTRHADLEARIAELAAAVQAAGEKLGVHEQDTSQQLNALKSIAEELVAKVDGPEKGSLSNKAADLSSKVSELQEGLGSMAGAVREQGSTLNTQLKALEQKVTSSLSDQVAQLTKKVEAAEKKLAAAGKADTKTSSSPDLEALTKRVTTLEEATAAAAASASKASPAEKEAAATGGSDPALAERVESVAKAVGEVADGLLSLKTSTAKEIEAVSLATAEVAGAVARDFKGVEDRMEAAEQAFNAMQDKLAEVERSVQATAAVAAARASIAGGAGGEGGVSADPASILSLQSDLAASSAGWEAQARMLRADIQSLLKESERLAAGLKASEAWAESFMSKEDVQDRLQEMRSEVTRSAAELMSSMRKSDSSASAGSAAADAATKAAVSDLTARLSTLEASLEDVRGIAEGAAPKRVAADLKDVETSVTKLRTDLESLSGRLQSLDASVKELGVVAREAQAKALSASRASLSGPAAGGGSGSQAAGGAASAADTGKLEQDVAELQSELKSMQAAVQQASKAAEEQAALSSKLESINSQVASSQNAMSTVTSALQTLKSSVDPLEERLAAVEGSLKPLSDSHPTLSQAVDELRSKMAEAAAAAEGQKAGASAEEVERLSKAVQRLDQVEPSVAGLVENRAAVEARLGALDAALAAQASRIEAAETAAAAAADAAAAAAKAAAEGAAAAAAASSQPPPAPPPPPMDPTIVPRLSAVEALVPKVATLEALGSRVATLEALGPRLTTLEAVAPKVVALEGLGPRVEALEALGPKVAALEGLAPKVAMLDQGLQVVAEAAQAHADAKTAAAAAPSDTQDPTLAPRLSDLEARLTSELSALQGTLAKVLVLEALVPKVATLEQGMQALASSTLQLQQARSSQAGSTPGMAPSTPAPSGGAGGGEGDLPLAAELRVAKLETGIKELGAIVEKLAASSSLSGGGALALAGGSGNLGKTLSPRDSGALEAAPPTRRELDELRLKVAALSTTVSSLLGQPLVSQPSDSGVPSDPPTPARQRGTVNVVTSVTAAAEAKSVAAQVQALQASQLQIMQQLPVMQTSLATLGGKVTMLEHRGSMGGSLPGAGGSTAASEADRMRTEQQLTLLQGALVQLNGEVNALKLKVPQLTASIKDANQGLDASQVTANVAAGQYGPVLAAVAEEVQRAAVRAEVVERDTRLALAAYAKAVDVSRLDTTLTERCSRLEEEVENLRQGVRTAIESGGKGGAVAMAPLARGKSAVPGAPSAIGDGTTGGAGADQRRFATWDALKHSETMLSKSQAQAKEDLMKVQNGLTDFQNRMSVAVEKLSGQLELREKVLMRMAQEVDELKQVIIGMQSSLKSAPPEPAPPPKSRAASRATSHRYSMFDD